MHFPVVGMLASILGLPRKGFRMKKYLLLLVVPVLGMLLFGCGKDQPATTNTQQGVATGSIADTRRGPGPMRNGSETPQQPEAICSCHEGV